MAERLPWNEKHSLYLVSEYPDKLKSWRRVETHDSVKNVLDKFDENKHALSTGGINFSSTQIRKSRKEAIGTVKENFLDEAANLLRALSRMKSKLTKCSLFFLNPRIIDHSERTDFAITKLISVINTVISHHVPQELRALSFELAIELQTAQQVLSPPTEICAILEKCDKMPSISNCGLFLKKYDTPETEEPSPTATMAPSSS